VASTLIGSVAPGCIVVATEETSISGSWTIDRGAPTASSCASIGIDTVQLTLYRPGSAVPYESLSAPCAAGFVDSRDARTFIGSGSYEYTFEAFRGASSVALSARRTITLFAGEHGRVSTDFASGTGFDPRGPDATAEARWTIDGRAPSAASCAALGVARVRIAFQNGGAWYEHPDLTASCAAGSIDTRPSPVVAAGTWTVQVQALDSAGAIVAQGMMATLTIPTQPPVSHLQMDPIDFTGGVFNPLGSDATVAGQWQFNGRAPTADSCYAVGIDRVRVVLFAPSDVAFERGVPVFQANCGTGFLDSRPMPVIRAGRYLWAVEAIDAAGDIVAEYSEMTPLDIPPASHLDLPLVDFAFPSTLTLGLSWQAGTGGALTTCAAAGVATYSYTLRRGGSIVATADARPCQDLISFNATDTAGFGSGSYALYFEGFNGAGRKQWAVLPGTCDAIRVDNGALVYEECAAAFTP
jgi:hypothetical protein